MSSKVEKIVPQSENSELGVVVNGTTLTCDFVIMGVGVAPATEFLKGSGIQIEIDGGVRVDEYLRVRNVPDVYAIGDIAIYPQKDGSDTRIEHWNVGGHSSLLLIGLVLLSSIIGCWKSGSCGWTHHLRQSTTFR